MALSASRSTPRRGHPIPVLINAPMKAATQGYKGGIACTDASGYFVPGATSTTLRCMGVFMEDKLGGASNGDTRTNVETGIFKFKNSSAGDAIAQSEVGLDCYIVDDETVAKTSGTNTRSIAGKVLEVESDGVWVKLGPV